MQNSPIRDLEIQSEQRLKAAHKPPLAPGKIVILPNGIIDERHLNNKVIQEHADEYQNFEGNSFFASSLADHDRYFEIDSTKEKMQSSLGGWY